MRYLTIIFLLCVVGLAQAQQSELEERWWWAYREATGEVLAYNADGDVNVILDDVKVLGIRRLDNQRGLMVTDAKWNENTGFYLLDTISAVRFEFEPMPADVIHINRFISLLARHHPYALLSYSTDNGIQLSSFDFETQIATIIQDDIELCPYSEDGCARLSQDATKVRYIRAVQSGESHLTRRLEFREFDVLTGEERLIYQTEIIKESVITTSQCDLSLYGEVALCYTYAEFEKSETAYYVVIYLDGRVEKLPKIDSPHMWTVVLSDDDVIIMDSQCSDGCKDISVYRPLKSQWLYFKVSFTGQSADLINENKLVLYTRPNYLITNNVVLDLGATDCCEPAPDDVYANRWMLSGGRVWDLERERPIIEYSQPLLDFHTEFGILIRVRASFQDKHKWVYIYEQDRLISLPFWDGEYIDMPDDHTILFITHGEQRNIYSYNLKTEIFTLLVENVEH